MRAYAFLDRDGTLVAERGDEQWAGCRAVDLLPGVGAALQGLVNAGFSLVVVTNQYPIGEGILTSEDYGAQTVSLRAAAADAGVELLDVLHCPHPRWIDCACAKPATGMVEEAERRHGPRDQSRSLVIGDSDVDMQLAGALGIRGERVGTALLDGPAPSCGFAQVVASIIGAPPTR